MPRRLLYMEANSKHERIEVHAMESRRLSWIVCCTRSMRSLLPSVVEEKEEDLTLAEEKEKEDNSTLAQR